MAFDLRMPKLGMAATKGTITKWFKAEAEEVTEGEPLIEVLTDKVTFQIESPCTGVVRKILVPVKREVPVGTLLAWIGSANEEIPDVAERETQAAAGAPIPVMAAATSSTGAATSAASASNAVVASPAAKRMAKEQGVDLAMVKPSGADGRVSSGDVLAYVAAQQAAAETEKAVNASPAARRLIHERGLDLSAIARALGDNRRITSEDVEAYLQSQKTTA
ncbi:MAG: E3 binding domain-containing protein, partial [Chloroflexi bacterium]|nr:E3 binding domain-containing protein [Chloroflexota bacterium]